MIPNNLFSPYGPEPYRSVGQVKEQVCRFLFAELVRWLVQSNQINVTQPAGQRRLQDGDTFADHFI